MYLFPYFKNACECKTYKGKNWRTWRKDVFTTIACAMWDVYECEINSFRYHVTIQLSQQISKNFTRACWDGVNWLELFRSCNSQYCYRIRLPLNFIRYSPKTTHHNHKVRISPPTYILFICFITIRST